MRTVWYGEWSAKRLKMFDADDSHSHQAKVQMKSFTTSVTSLPSQVCESVYQILTFSLLLDRLSMSSATGRILLENLDS